MGSNQNADASNGSAEGGNVGGVASASAAAAAAKRDSYQVKKRNCYLFILLAAFACFIVGIVVYYLAHLDCENVSGVGGVGSDNQTGGPDGEGGKKKQKVSIKIVGFFGFQEVHLWLSKLTKVKNWSTAG